MSGQPRLNPEVQLTDQPYAYAGSDPVNGTDPLGHWSWNPISDFNEAASNLGGKLFTIGEALCQVDPFTWTVTKIRGPLQFGVVCVWVATSLASR